MCNGAGGNGFAFLQFFVHEFSLELKSMSAFSWGQSKNVC